MTKRIVAKIVDDAIDYVHKNGAQSFPLVKLVAAKRIATPTETVTATPTNPGHATFSFNGSGLNATTCGSGHVSAAAAMLDRVAHAKTTYGNVAATEHFKTLYNVQPRQLSYVVNGVAAQGAVINGTFMPAAMEDSAPCMTCGLVLPLKLLTIDHQRPQAGGELEAICKAFRICGLTLEGPHGSKGLSMRNNITQGTPLAAATPKLGRGALVAGNKNDRYTLNAMGIALYSLITQFGGEDDLKVRCMHGAFNLAPLCGPCNSSKSNALKF